MARTTYVLRDGELVPKDQAAPLHASHGEGPMIIRDEMDATRSMIDGSMHTSKRGYGRHVRANGCEIAGNERAPFEASRFREYQPRGVGESIKRAIAELGG